MIIVIKLSLFGFVRNKRGVQPQNNIWNGKTIYTCYKRHYFVFADLLADILIRLREKGTILRSRTDAIYHNYSST